MSLSCAHVIELKRQLQNLQKGNFSITDYLLRHKTIVDELSAAGHFIDESDQVTRILDGLSEEYDPVVINVHGCPQSIYAHLYCLFSWLALKFGDADYTSWFLLSLAL